MIITTRNGFQKLVATAVAASALAACGSNPTIGMTANEIAQHLGYSSLSPGAQIPSEASFSPEQVNSKAVVFDYGNGREYLLTFSQVCLGLRSGTSLTTHSTDRMLEAGDSVVIDSNEYCRIEEIYRLVGKAE